MEGTPKEWQKKKKWGGTKAIKTKRMLTLLSVWWLASVHMCLHARAWREGAAEHRVIICKKWITLRLDCWAQWRASAHYDYQAPPRTTTFKSSCQPLDRSLICGIQRGAIQEATPQWSHAQSANATLTFSVMIQSLQSINNDNDNVLKM